MSTEGNSQHIKIFKRTQSKRNSSSTYTDSSSDEELTPRNKKFLPNLVFPGSNVKACSETKRTKKNSFKRASQKKSTKASVGMHDLEKFSKSLIKDLKVESKKMLAQFKKDLRNVAAANSTGHTTKNRGSHIVLNTGQAHVQKSPHSEPQGQHMISSSTRGFIPPVGQQIQGSVCASNTEFNPGRESLLIDAANRSSYLNYNVLAQSSYPNASHVMGFGNLSPLHRNNIHTSGMVPGFQRTLHQRLGNTFHIPNQTLAGNSYGGTVDALGWNMNRGPIMLSGSSSAVSNSTVATNRFTANDFHSNLNLRADEAWLRMYGPHNGNFQ